MDGMNILTNFFSLEVWLGQLQQQHNYCLSCRNEKREHQLSISSETTYRIISKTKVGSKITEIYREMRIVLKQYFGGYFL